MSEVDFIADEPPVVATRAAAAGQDWLMTGFLVYFGVVALTIMTFLLVAWTNA